jgi:hypothetical protein
MAKELGWIKVHRKIQDTVGYFAEPFCRNMAWIDLLLLANHEDNFFRFRGIRVDVKRGQTGVSIETFCDRWKWSRGKTERWLKELEKDKKIVRQKDNVTTLISILNYSQYQDNDKASDKASSNADGQQTVKQTDTNKNDKKEEEGKNTATAVVEMGIVVVKEIANKVWSDKKWMEELCIGCGLTMPGAKDWMRQFNLSVSQDAIEGFNHAKYKKMFQGWLRSKLNGGQKVTKLKDADAEVTNMLKKHGL